jgi:hypothetical protein
LPPCLAPRRLSAMFCATTRPRLLSTHPSAPIAPRWSRLPKRKNAHRGLATSAKPASAPTHSQVSIASGENSRCCTKARRTPLLPQGDLETVAVNAPQTQCPTSSPEVVVTARQGAYGAVGLNGSPGGFNLGLNINLNLFTYNTPSNGDPYLSHGITTTVTVGPVKLGFQWQQNSYDGGLSFQTTPDTVILANFRGSSGGVNYRFTPPQIGSGFIVELDNIAGLLPTGDTPQCH